MQADGVTVCFIAFGSDKCKELAKQFGITDVIKTDASVRLT